MSDNPITSEEIVDIHARTAQEMFGTVDRDTRARAKTINFAILYGSVPVKSLSAWMPLPPTPGGKQ